jgi:hypothetical protein
MHIYFLACVVKEKKNIVSPASGLFCIASQVPAAKSGQRVHNTSNTSVVDPHHLDAEPDSTYYPDADPDSTYHPDADPDPTLHPDASK